MENKLLKDFMRERRGNDKAILKAIFTLLERIPTKMFEYEYKLKNGK